MKIRKRDVYYPERAGVPPAFPGKTLRGTKRNGKRIIMNLKTELFLAWKYFKPKRSAVSVITLISVIGVGLGVAVLIVVLAVMTGFTDHLKEKLLDTGAHAQIRKCFRTGPDYFGPPGGTLIQDPEKLIEIVKSLGGDAEALVLAPVLLQSGDNFAPKGLIGMDPENRSGRIKLQESVVYPETSFRLGRGEVAVSTVIANQYRLGLGSRILLHAPSRLARLIEKNADGKFQMAKNTDYYLPGEYTVSAIYSFGKYDFDREMIFMNLEDADELFGYPWGAATEVYVWTDDPFHMGSFLSDLDHALQEQAPDCEVRSWKEIHGRILSVLQVEKNMQFFLLIFIVLVAAFSITNTLITTVIQKTKEIGLLKAMGAGAGTVMNVFLLQGLFVGLLGTSLGVALGCMVVHYRMAILRAMRFMTGQEIFPKEIYQFSELPAHIVLGDLVLISVISIVLCTLGAVIPAIRAAKLDPARALRYE